MNNLRIFLLIICACVCSIPSYAKKEVTFINTNIEKKQSKIKYQAEINAVYALNLDKGQGYNTDYFAVETIHGIKIAKYVFVGAGVGLNWFYGGKEISLPVFLATRFYYPLKSQFTPYILADVGYGIPIDNTGEEFSFSVGIGCKYSLFNLGIGWKHYIDDTFYKTSNNYGYVKIGIYF